MEQAVHSTIWKPLTWYRGRVAVAPHAGHGYDASERFMIEP
jgi:hypothetical protein